MHKSKIKVFLAAFVNQTNAQNLSCRTLAKYLDKELFEVYTLEIGWGDLPRLREKGVHVFTCHKPLKIWGKLGLAWGYWKADIVYIPRGDFHTTHVRLTQFFKKVTFKTVRNVIDDHALKTAVSLLYRDTGFKIEDGYNYLDHLYSMTQYMKVYNSKRWGIETKDKILLPPINTAAYKAQARVRSNLYHIIFIGNDWHRKGLSDLIEVANSFPELQFHVVGRGDTQQFSENLQNDNVIFHGIQSGNDLIDLVHKADLHILPSRSEGVPRVWLEALTNGLPSIMYYGYGLENLLNDGEDGYMVDGVGEIKEKIRLLKDQPQLLEALSQKALASSERFAAEVLVRQYETEIIDMVECNN